jgi:asparagine synthase (glutamine-hydrolysing)
MCGIVAIYARGARVDETSIAAGIRSLHHRGPDGEGRWLSGDSKVGLGHARLSIIDLDTGTQPIANEDGSVQIVVNGELYDHDRIRKQLVERGHSLRTASDSEIALHLYEDYGVGCLEHLRGEFAFVLWDSRKRMLLAARDRFGIKPLYYAEVGGTLYFGSEIKALFAAGVEPRWDHEQVCHTLLFQALADRSLFAGVQQVPAGHCLIATAGSTRIVRYWDFDYPTTDAIRTDVDEREWVEQLRARLLEAVRLRLRADVPVGAYLSGGIDSCAMLGMATHVLGRPITAFTISFEDERFDEAGVAEAMAKHAGAEFHCFRMDNALRADNFADAVRHNETVVAGNVVSKFMLSQRVRELGYKVVLTGEGSDEIFAGYAPFRYEKIADDESLDAAEKQALLERIGGERRVRAANAGAREALLAGPSFDSVRRRLGFVPAWLGDAGRAERIAPWLSGELRARVSGCDPLAAFLDTIDPAQLRGRPRLHQSMYLWSKSRLQNTMLRGLGDRSEMAHSIEGRLPMLDHEVVALAVQIPPALKVKGVVEKYVLREAVRPFVTPQVFERRKHPFVAPIALGEHYGAMLRDLLHGGGLDALPFFDSAKLRSAFDRVVRTPPKARPSWTREDWSARQLAPTAAALCVLQQTFGVRTA